MLASESDLHAARVAVVHITADALAETSARLERDARAGTSKRLLGLSIVSGMAAEIGLAALTLYERGMWYAGAALTRQLVEHHHLCAYFADDQSRMELWLDADDEARRKSFAPARLREAGGFTPTDYAVHCTWGGHPNPAGSWLLRTSVSDGPHRLLLVDLSQHLQFIYVAVCECLGDEANELPGMVKAYNYLLKWQAVDPCAKGLPVGATAQHEAEDSS